MFYSSSLVHSSCSLLQNACIIYLSRIYISYFKALIMYSFMCSYSIIFVLFCVFTGHFVMMPLNMTCLHCLQHSFFERLFNLYYLSCLCYIPRSCLRQRRPTGSSSFVDGNPLLHCAVTSWPRNT